jgi:hypothetical protein
MGHLQLGNPTLGHAEENGSLADRQLSGELPGELAGLAGHLGGVALDFLAPGAQLA